MIWTQDLSTGVDGIDEQHKEMFEMAEQLFGAGQNRRGKDFIADLYDFLDNYTKKHFSDEEKYMQSIGYPGLEEQKQQHEEFILQLDHIKKEFDESGRSVAVIIKTNKMISNWLIEHISKLDKKIGEYARAQKE